MMKVRNQRLLRIGQIIGILGVVFSWYFQHFKPTPNDLLNLYIDVIGYSISAVGFFLIFKAVDFYK